MWHCFNTCQHVVDKCKHSPDKLIPSCHFSHCIRKLIFSSYSFPSMIDYKKLQEQQTVIVHYSSLPSFKKLVLGELTGFS